LVAHRPQHGHAPCGLLNAGCDAVVVIRRAVFSALSCMKSYVSNGADCGQGRIGLIIDLKSRAAAVLRYACYFTLNHNAPSCVEGRVCQTLRR